MHQKFPKVNMKPSNVSFTHSVHLRQSGVHCLAFLFFVNSTLVWLVVAASANKNLTLPFFQTPGWPQKHLHSSPNASLWRAAFMLTRGFNSECELGDLSGRRGLFLQCAPANSAHGVGGPVVPASQEASLLFRPGRQSLCLPSSLDILVSVKEDK